LCLFTCELNSTEANYKVSRSRQKYTKITKNKIKNKDSLYNGIKLIIIPRKIKVSINRWENWNKYISKSYTILWRERIIHVHSHTEVNNNSNNNNNNNNNAINKTYQLIIIIIITARIRWQDHIGRWISKNYRKEIQNRNWFYINEFRVDVNMSGIEPSFLVSLCQP
jgi:hypothetical protein